MDRNRALTIAAETGTTKHKHRDDYAKDVDRNSAAHSITPFLVTFRAKTATGNIAELLRISTFNECLEVNSGMIHHDIPSSILMVPLQLVQEPLMSLCKSIHFR